MALKKTRKDLYSFIYDELKVKMSNKEKGDLKKLLKLITEETLNEKTREIFYLKRKIERISKPKETFKPRRSNYDEIRVTRY